MPDEVATKTCSKCRRVFYKALFPSMKLSECEECCAERRKKYNKQFGRDPRRKWRNNLLFGRKDEKFEWERHIDLQEIN